MRRVHEERFEGLEYHQELAIDRATWKLDIHVCQIYKLVAISFRFHL
jgi:hypothetical protein